jgi:hypothetical protein
MSASYFAFNCGKNAPATFTILEVTIGEQTMGKNTRLEWFSKFRSSVTYPADAQTLCTFIKKQTDESAN